MIIKTIYAFFDRHTKRQEQKQQTHFILSDLPIHANGGRENHTPCNDFDKEIVHSFDTDEKDKPSSSDENKMDGYKSDIRKAAQSCKKLKEGTFLHKCSAFIV